MKVEIVTALFDIDREKKGDGRTMAEYLSWFDETLSLKCDMTVFVPREFQDFVFEKRKSAPNDTNIVIHEFEECPYYKYIRDIDQVLKSKEYRDKIQDPSRIECILPEYSVIQYSKFKWLERSAGISNPDYLFWMDAGCSRFFNGFDFSREWPNKTLISPSKLTIQTSEGYQEKFELLKGNHFLDNQCCLVGTLFGGTSSTLNTIGEEIELIFNEMLAQNCINNEQIALAVLYSRKPELFNIVKNDYFFHLPLFSLLS